MRQHLSPAAPSAGRHPGRARGCGQAGTGLFASVFGLLFVIGFLLLASEVLLNLHRASVVRAAALDAAHAAAEAGGGTVRGCDAGVEGAAASRATDLLGPSAQVVVSCRADEAVAVTVETPRARLAGFLGPTVIRRSAEVRFETFRGTP